MIDFNNIYKHFGTQEILHDASFKVNAGERVGIVGPNGAGKSTVFSLILGETSPDGGSIEIPKTARLGHLRQEFNPHEVNSTLIEYAESGRQDLIDIHNEIEGIERDILEKPVHDTASVLAHLGKLQMLYEAGGGYSMRSRAKAALSGLGLGEDKLSRPFSSFSGGWQMRAELARVLVSEPDILLLDEPTNYLDIPAVEWLREYLKRFTGTMLLISHDRYLLNSLTSTTIEVANRETARYKGNYDYYVKERQIRYEQRLAAMKNQQKFREQSEQFIQRFRAKNTKAAQVQSRIKMLERMEEIRIPQQVISPGRIRLKKPQRCGHELVRAENVGLTYDGQTWVLRGVDISVQQGDKIAFVGLNGTGKSSFLRVIAGILPPSEGTCVLGHNVVPGYQSQEFAETMDPGLTVFETLKAVGGEVTAQEIRNLLGGFGFSGDAVEKKVAVLSGGEKVRLAFARILVNPPNLLILDEPTTHLDISAREALEKALGEFAGTICFVSHDVEFVRNVATSVAAMQPPGIRRYCGGYDYYCEKSAIEKAALESTLEKPEYKESDRKITRRERANFVQERGRRRRELTEALNEAEKQIESLESEQNELVARIENPEGNINYHVLNRRLNEIHKELPEVLKIWEESSLALEKLKKEMG